MAKNYFEGWYYKHQFKDDTLICIPGIHDEEGVRRGLFSLYSGIRIVIWSLLRMKSVP